ncbi:MAG: hypothetical protein ACREJC_01350 [Tepidisphaeraceae bacterium]
MNSSIRMASVVVGLALLGAFGFELTRARASGVTNAPSTQPVNKLCAVQSEHPIDPNVTVVYKDMVIGFCCKDCIPDFQKEPEKYVKNLK